MNNRQAKIKGYNMFHYYDYPTTKGNFKKIMKRKTRTELKKIFTKRKEEIYWQIEKVLVRWVRQEQHGISNHILKLKKIRLNIIEKENIRKEMIING